MCSRKLQRFDPNSAAHVRRRRRLPNRLQLAVRSVRLQHGKSGLQNQLRHEHGLRIAEQLRRGKLRRKPNGTNCSVGSECDSGICAQGVCCSTTCTGTCASCALSGTLGTCSAVPAGQDPLSQCTASDVSTCGTDGYCNGSGACRLYAAGTPCVAATCTGNTLTPTATCNGTGTCNTPANLNCSPYFCGTGACRTDCATNADCQGPTFVCVGATCSSGTNLTVKLKTDPTGTQWITMAYQITNNGTTPIPMSDLTLRYWYTYDTTPIVAQAAGCNYAFTPPSNCTNIVFNGPWVAVNPPKTGADFYYQVGFAAAAGSLNSGATADFQTRVPQERLDQLHPDQRLLVQRTNHLHAVDEGHGLPGGSAGLRHRAAIRISVVSRDGLISLKSRRGSGLDQDDIKHLRGTSE